MQPVKKALPSRRVQIEGAGAREHGYEITYWSAGRRTIMFLCFNPEIVGSSTGGGNSAGLKTDMVPVTLTFRDAVKDARNERTGKALGDGRQFKVDWSMNEAVVVSFAAPN